MWDFGQNKPELLVLSLHFIRIAHISKVTLQYKTHRYNYIGAARNNGYNYDYTLNKHDNTERTTLVTALSITD